MILHIRKVSKYVRFPTFICCLWRCTQQIRRLIIINSILSFVISFKLSLIFNIDVNMGRVAAQHLVIHIYIFAIEFLRMLDVERSLP